MDRVDLIVLLLSFAVLAACATALLLDFRSRLVRVDGVYFRLRPSKHRGSSEHLFMSLHGLRRSPVHALARPRPWVALEVRGRRGDVEFGVWVPRGQEAFVTSVLRGTYPGMEFERADTAADHPYQAVGEFRLARGNYLPIRTLFDEEPLANVVATMMNTDAGVALRLLVRPKAPHWQAAAYGDAQRLRRGGDTRWWPLAGGRADARATQFERARAKATESKAAGLGFDCVLCVVVGAATRQEAHALIRAVAAALLPYSDSNSFALRRIRSGPRLASKITARFPLFGSALLTAKELAAIWHIPDEAVLGAGSGHLRPPPGVERGERVIGLARSHRGDVRVGLSIADSRSHLHLLGSTGTGKTTVLLGLAAQDISAGRGVAVLDPKGDLVRGLLERIPRDRIKDVVLISPEDAATSVGVNPLQLWPGDDRDLVAENALTIFKRIYERYWGPRTDDILKAALLTLVHQEGATLAHIPLLLTDAEHRARATAHLDDPLGLEGFWRWFEGLSDRQRLESVGPVLNKLRDFLVRPRLRRLLCQPRSTVDLRSVVDEGQILLADLSVGRWGDTAAALIGSFLVARLWQAVLARSARPERDRRDFFLFLDEFQHFVGISGPFSDALAEARGLRLSLTMANQHLGQLPRELREAIASNARSRLVFQCGQDDAVYLARELAPLDASALMSLERYEAAARLVVDGRSSRPFTLRTLAPALAPDPRIAREVTRASASRFGRPTQEVDAELRGLLSTDAVREGAERGKVRTRRRSIAAAAIEQTLSSLNEDRPDPGAKSPRSSRNTPSEGPKPV